EPVGERGRGESRLPLYGAGVAASTNGQSAVRASSRVPRGAGSVCGILRLPSGEAAARSDVRGGGQRGKRVIGPDRHDAAGPFCAGVGAVSPVVELGARGGCGDGPFGRGAGGRDRGGGVFVGGRLQAGGGTRSADGGPARGGGDGVGGSVGRGRRAASA